MGELLEVARTADPMPRIVYASSSSVYGMGTKVPFAETDRVDNPASLYAATKKANEMIAHSYKHIYGLSMIGLRFFTVYGPWGRPDMAAGCVGAVDRVTASTRETAEYHLLNLGNKDPVTVSYLVECIEEALGKKAVRNYMPMPPTGDVLKKCRCHNSGEG